SSANSPLTRAGPSQAPVVWLAVSYGVESAAGRFVVPTSGRKGAGRPLSRPLGVHRSGRGRHSPVARRLLEMAATSRCRVQGLLRLRRWRRGVALIEAESADALARTTAPWTPWLRFTTNPIVPIEESAAIAGEAVAFRDSVS